jgi:hypothetical protein
VVDREVRRQAEDYRELTPTQVALQLAQLSRALNEITQEQEGFEVDVVEKREFYTKEYAKTFLQEPGNNEERKQAALLKTSEYRIAAELADAMLKMHLARIASLRKRIDIARSAAALVRAEWELQQAGGRTRGG